MDQERNNGVVVKVLFPGILQKPSRQIKPQHFPGLEIHIPVSYSLTRSSDFPASYNMTAAWPDVCGIRNQRRSNQKSVWHRCHHVRVRHGSRFVVGERVKLKARSKARSRRAVFTVSWQLGILGINRILLRAPCSGRDIPARLRWPRYAKWIKRCKWSARNLPYLRVLPTELPE